jgi:hypothetical protein
MTEMQRAAHPHASSQVAVEGGPVDAYPYLDPTMKLSLKARLLCGLIAFPVSVSAFWFGIRMSQRK